MICLRCRCQILHSSRIAGICLVCEPKVETLVLPVPVISRICAIAQMTGIEPADVVERLTNGHIRDIAEKVNGREVVR
jgi:hypothetical protein